MDPKFKDRQYFQRYDRTLKSSFIVIMVNTVNKFLVGQTVCLMVYTHVHVPQNLTLHVSLCCVWFDFPA